MRVSLSLSWMESIVNKMQSSFIRKCCGFPTVIEFSDPRSIITPVSRHKNMMNDLIVRKLAGMKEITKRG